MTASTQIKKKTRSQTLTHTHTQYDPSWQSMTQFLYEPLPLGSDNSVVAQSVFLARDRDLMHTVMIFFSQSVSILHEQRHTHTCFSTNNEQFLHLCIKKSLMLSLKKCPISKCKKKVRLQNPELVKEKESSILPCVSLTDPTMLHKDLS